MSTKTTNPESANTSVATANKQSITSPVVLSIKRVDLRVKEVAQPDGSTYNRHYVCFTFKEYYDIHTVDTSGAQVDTKSNTLLMPLVMVTDMLADTSVMAAIWMSTPIEAVVVKLCFEKLDKMTKLHLLLVNLLVGAKAVVVEEFHDAAEVMRNGEAYGKDVYYYNVASFELDKDAYTNVTSMLM